MGRIELLVVRMALIYYQADLYLPAQAELITRETDAGLK